MNKLIYELLTEPLGLPINAFYEYVILLLIDWIAYEYAFKKTGLLMRTGTITRRMGSETHWAIRLTIFVGCWAVARVLIWIYGFVIENKGLSIFASFCIALVIFIIRFSVKRERTRRLESVRKRVLVRIDETKELE